VGTTNSLQAEKQAAGREGTRSRVNHARKSSEEAPGSKYQSVGLVGVA